MKYRDQEADHRMFEKIQHLNRGVTEFHSGITTNSVHTRLLWERLVLTLKHEYNWSEYRDPETGIVLPLVSSDEGPSILSVGLFYLGGEAPDSFFSTILSRTMCIAVVTSLMDDALRMLNQRSKQVKEEQTKELHAQS